MEPLVFFAVLFAALLHATWNALIKLGTSKVNTMLIMTVVQGGIGAAIALGRPVPLAQVWPWLIASGLVHTVYKLFLAYAYEHGDLSRVYPIARGAAPLIVLVLSFFLLGDPVTGLQYLGIIVLGLGILAMAQGAFSGRESRKLVPLALGSACATAAYSIIDGLGARISGDPATFVAWLFVFDAILFVPICLMLRGPSVLRADRRSWALASVGSAASYGAYAIAVWAMTIAPIAVVTALRETSILFAVLIGWLFFREPMDRGKALAAGLIVAGVALTRL